MTAAAAASRQGARNRRHGHDTERMVVAYLRAEGWPDAMTTRSKLGHDGATAPGDVEFHPLICLEVKSVKGSSWPTWCRQAAAEARPGMVPVVVRRTAGVTDVGLWPVRLLERHAILVLGMTVPLRAHPVGDEEAGVTWWVKSTMAELVAAVRAVDA